MARQYITYLLTAECAHCHYYELRHCHLRLFFLVFCELSYHAFKKSFQGSHSWLIISAQNDGLFPEFIIGVPRVSRGSQGSKRFQWVPRDFKDAQNTLHMYETILMGETSSNLPILKVCKKSVTDFFLTFFGLSKQANYCWFSQLELFHTYAGCSGHPWNPLEPIGTPKNSLETPWNPNNKLRKKSGKSLSF